MRNILGRFDDTGGKYEPSVREHPVLGRLDYTHLPLDLVRRVCPEDFDKIRRYHAFALVRDPQTRFVSALSQRFKMYNSRELAQLDRSEVNRLAREVVETLRREPDATRRPEFVHFARQSDYIFLDGDQLVETIQPTSKAGDMIQQISQLTGEELGDVGNDNPTMVFRSGAFRRMALAGKWIGERTLGPETVRRGRKVARRAMMKPLLNSRDAYTLSDDVSDFVQDYYAQDLKLYEKVKKACKTSQSKA